HAGHNFIAVGNADHAIETMCLDHSLDTISDEFATGQRVLHANMTHGNSVIYTNGIKFKRHPACLANSLFDQFAKGLQVNMSRHNIHIRVAHSNKWFGEIFFSYHTSGAQQPTVRRSFKAELDLV